jgi:glutaredoxin 3
MMLTVYSKTVCPYCVQAKNYLKNKNIVFNEINIEEDQEARDFIMGQGHRTVPQIYFNGSLFIEGGWQGLSKMSAEQILEKIELRNSLINGTL